MMTRRPLLLLALAAAALVPTATKAQTTYVVDQTLGTGTVVGTIITNGTLGVLSQSDIIGGSVTITATGPSESYTASLPASIYQFSGGDLTATAASLLFNFSGSDAGGIAIGSIPLDFFWNIGTAGFSYGTGPYPGENIYPQGNSTPVLSGDVVIASATPEPGGMVLFATGLLGIAFLLRRTLAL